MIELYHFFLPAGNSSSREIAVGLATDLAEFRVAAAVSSIAVLALFGAQALLNPSLIVSLVASLMMQILFGLLRWPRWRAASTFYSPE